MNISFSQQELRMCVLSSPIRYTFSAWFSVYLLFLPVFLFVLYISFNKWKKPQPSGSGGLSHSDVFTLNMVAMEMTNLVGACVACYATFYLNDEKVVALGRTTVMTTSTGQMLFHSLTCVERYLAVVHPVAYLRLRGGGGVTIRNICIGVVWVFSLGYFCLLCVLMRCTVFKIVSNVVLSIAPLPFVAYCSIYVLHILTRPKPGESGGLRKQIGQSKRFTVYTMVAILAALLLRVITDVVYSTTYFIPWLDIDRCLMSSFSLWSTLPSSLVLPLLFLQRAGKLTGCK